MEKKYSRMIITTEADGTREVYPFCCREEAASNLALSMYFDSADAYAAFRTWSAEWTEESEEIDPDDSGAFEEWTDYAAYDLIDEAMKNGRSAAYGVAVEVTADECPYEYDRYNGIVYTDEVSA